MEQIINGLKLKALFVLNEEEYKKFERYINNRAWNNLRLYVSDLVEEYELKAILEDEDYNNLTALEEISDGVLDIIINNYDGERLNEGRERIIRRTG